MAVKFIDYDGKKYPIKEPTIRSYANVMAVKDLLNDEELFVRMISELTDLKREEILQCKAEEIQEVGNIIKNIFNQENKEIHYEIVHKGIKYKFLDFNNVSFGQFVDIDTFLSKDENYRIQNLNELAAYLYTKEGETYSQSDFKQRIEDFKDLPIKYLDSSVFFLVNLGLILFPLTQMSSKQRFQWKITMMLLRLQSIGDGTQPSLFYPKTVFGKLIGWLIFPLWLVSIILHSLWTTMLNKIKKTKT